MSNQVRQRTTWTGYLTFSHLQKPWMKICKVNENIKMNILFLCSCLICIPITNILHLLSSLLFFCAVLVLFVVTWCQMYTSQPLQNKYSTKQKSFVVNKVLPYKYRISKYNEIAFHRFELDINLLDLKVSQCLLWWKCVSSLLWLYMCNALKTNALDQQNSVYLTFYVLFCSVAFLNIWICQRLSKPRFLFPRRF